ncbi:hypothetical protein K458DRAFT_421804 [Lentithecium fluviatile CBS 122367]|uniref:Extracellular membrane protein CFEM domain-containing protein n=1 Tax=Lentithecium fluviatile CBS 122367 TaxID=1168545 RepID=A0A6G1IPQ4_9PLEO|nr:hypothetical protein K458DRAFT_421804 [Lentithecium fluviatile CBS 122367]
MVHLSSVFLPLLHVSITLCEQIVSASIESYSGYLQQKQCVKDCIWKGSWYDDTKPLMPGIGCSNPLINDCLCRSDQAPPASKFLTTCVHSSCGTTATVDLSRAVSVYDAYCIEAGYTNDGHVQVAQTTPANSNPQAPTVTQATVVTETAKSSNAGSHSLTTSGEFRAFIARLVVMTGAVMYFMYLR